MQGENAEREAAEHKIFLGTLSQELQYVMRRAGQNPTESEVQDMVNKVDDGSASLNFEVCIKHTCMQTHIKTLQASIKFTRLEVELSLAKFLVFV